MSRVDPLARLELMAVFIAGILVGLVAFKQDWAQQRADADHFLGGELLRLFETRHQLIGQARREMYKPLISDANTSGTVQTYASSTHLAGRPVRGNPPSTQRQSSRPASHCS